MKAALSVIGTAGIPLLAWGQNKSYRLVVYFLLSLCYTNAAAQRKAAQTPTAMLFLLNETLSILLLVSPEGRCKKACGKNRKIKVKTQRKYQFGKGKASKKEKEKRV